MKRESKIAFAMIVPASTIWPDMASMEGKFVAVGQLASVDDDRFHFGVQIRTSEVLRVDVHAGVIETKNTIYRIVA